MTVVAAYLRVSKADDDAEDETLTLKTQRRRIKALCVARGWTYGPEYIDEGVSATKPRGPKTAWARMLSDIGTGKFEFIITRDLDRLLRTLKDLVELIELGARIATVDGEIDLTTADGEFRATMLAAVARFEIRRKSERAIAANETRRLRGQPVIRVKILGYTEDGMEQIPEEAAAVKKAFEDYLSGVRITQIGRDLAESGFTSSRGTPWGNANIRSLLTNARYKGVITKWEPDPAKRAVSGALMEQEYPGGWEPIVTADVFDAVQQKLRDPARKRHWGTEPRYLMSGLLLCSKCDDGTKMFTSWFYPPKRVRKSGELVKSERVRIYRCLRQNHLSRNAEPIDELVDRLVVGRLNREDAHDLFLPPDESGLDREALRIERVALSERYEGLAALAADGVLPMDRVREQSARLTGRINEIDGLLAAAPESIGRLLVQAADVEAAWYDLDIARQRLVIKELMTVTVLPVVRKKGVPRGDDVKVEWLL